MFGRKIVNRRPEPFLIEPCRSHNETNDNVRRSTDDALSVVSQRFGFDVDFGTAYIFAPSHWRIAEVGLMLSRAGMESNARGNVIPLLRSPASVATLNSMSPDSPIRKALEQLGFGMVLFDPDVENGFSDEFSKMQAQTLTDMAAKYHEPRSRQLAVFDLHRFSSEVMKGRVKI